MDSYTVNLIVVTASFVLLLATEPFYREPLFNASVAVIVELQKTVTPTIEFFFKAVSDMGAIGTTLILLIGGYVWFSRERAFYYVSLFAAQMFL